ncbi:hypothetical protein [Enterococcus spodopteracolus]|uniref:hypothetical protein n=1 Tax=Enterococcus spodopteracolus TaxID=3034501 RepID=UPI002647169D|nr:hypothetical protein [Enterococcus spodopteracolus]
MERTRETFNDGVLFYGINKALYSDKRKKIGVEFELKGRLFYKLMYARDSDYQMCRSLGAVLEIKLKTLKPRNFNQLDMTKLIIMINDKRFEVIKTDHDANYLYFYLTKTGGNYVEEN